MAITRFYRGRSVDLIMDWSPSTRKRKIKEGILEPPMEISPGIRAWTEAQLERCQKRLLEHASRKQPQMELAE